MTTTTSNISSPPAQHTFQITDDETNRFRDLSSTTCSFPFRVDGVEYKSVLQFVYSRLVHSREDQRRLLWETQPRRLRALFNQLADEEYISVSRKIVSRTVFSYFNNHPEDRVMLKRATEFTTPRRACYYISNEDNVWGITESGFGFNLIGLAYSKYLYNSFSSYYAIRKDTIAMIYNAGQVLLQRFQSGHDILEFMGRPCQDILLLMDDHQHLSHPITEDDAWRMYVDGRSPEYVQLEIDYPCNLAGFIRKKYMSTFNYYLRTRFHSIMIRHYFVHVMKTRFSDAVASGDIDEQVKRMIQKMSTAYYEDLANRLYYMYNDPDTTSRLSFLTPLVRQELYDIEIQFKTQRDIEQAEHFVPFLYHAPKESSLFIYHAGDEFFELFEPYTTSLSPFALPIASQIVVELIRHYTGISEDVIRKTYHLSLQKQEYRRLLARVTDTWKERLAAKALRSKVDQNPILKLLVFNTSVLQDDVRVEDPDPIISKALTDEMLRLRQPLLANPLYQVCLYLSDDMYVQDRVRYRLEDFKTSMRCFAAMRGGGDDGIGLPISASDFTDLEDFVYMDPAVFFDGWRDQEQPIHAFSQYMSGVCSKEVQRRVWAFLVHLVARLSNKTNTTSSTNNNHPVLARDMKHLYICRVVCHMVNVFAPPPIQEDYNLRPLIDFIRCELGVSERFAPPPLPLTLSSHQFVMETMLRNHLDFSKYPSTLTTVVLYFTAFLSRVRLSETKLEFLATAPRLVHAKTPESFRSAMQSHLHTPSSFTTKKSASSKKVVKRTLPNNNINLDDAEDVMEQQQHDILMAMASADTNNNALLDDLGLEDDDDDGEEEEEDDDAFSSESDGE